MTHTICKIPPGTRYKASGEIDVATVRKLFPIFKNCDGTVFFDNAATSQKPEKVLRRIAHFYRHECANAGRADYSASTLAASAIEDCRNKVAQFVHTSSNQIAFTSGATDSLNTVALGWGLANLKSGDEVMVCLEDHKSAVMPWLNLQSMLAKFAIAIKIVAFDIHTEGNYELKSIRDRFTSRTRLLAMTHVHHLYGLDMEVAQVREIVGDNVLIALDVSQSIGHRTVDATQLPVDFLCFSGHKMFAATGVGVLWTSARAQVQMAAVKAGRTSVGQSAPGFSSTCQTTTTLASLVETGTPNIAAVLSMAPAIDFIEQLEIDSIERRVSKLTHYLRSRLQTLPGIDFSPGFGRTGCPIGYGVVSFRFEQIPTSDLAFLLDSEKVQVRTGNFCLSKRNQGDDYARISMHVYNTESEIDRLIEILETNIP